jgi:hypothetical protein
MKDPSIMLTSPGSKCDNFRVSILCFLFDSAFLLRLECLSIWFDSVPQQPTMKACVSLFVVLGLLTVAVQSFSPTTLRSHAAASMRLYSDMGGDFLTETPEATQERIQELVDNHPVLLFMKGSKLFPQCGFSNTGTCV